LTAYAIDDQHPNDIFSGDPVKTTGSASLLNGRAFIDVAGSSDIAVGVFAGVRYIDSNGEQQFRPRWIGGTVVQEDPRSPVEALVYDDPDMRFVIQVSGAAGLVAANVGQKADYLVGAGNSFTGRSAFELDQSGIGGTGPLKILGLAGPTVNNDFGEFADALVLIDLHENRSLVTAI
jgi:hypothetical protein